MREVAEPSHEPKSLISRWGMAIHLSELSMWFDMPISIRFLFVFSGVMAMAVAVLGIGIAAYTPGVNALVPISLCFSCICMLCGFIAHQNKQIMELKRRIIELEECHVEKSTETGEEIS